MKNVKIAAPTDASWQRTPEDDLIRPTRAEIRLSAVRHNLELIRSLAGPTVEVMPVIKANAYGHGAVPIGRLLEAAQVPLMGVALVEEGLALRRAGLRTPIVVLGGAYAGGYAQLIENELIPMVFQQAHLEGMAREARRLGRRQVKVHLKLDTGMGRIGVRPDELPAFLDTLGGLPELELDGLASHFANADLADAEMTRLQIQRFRDALGRLRAMGVNPRYRHLANSAAVMDRPEVRDGLELNLVRPGLMLYGVSPAEWLGRNVPLQPVLHWKTAITHLKRVPANTPISYGGTWVTKRESLIATLPVGYADGYSRHYSSQASVLVRGKRVPIAGRVCMDMCMIDVTELPDVTVGEEVVLLGSQGAESITAEELAALSHTINYEVLCGVGARVPRVTLELPGEG